MKIVALAFALLFMSLWSTTLSAQPTGLELGNKSPEIKLSTTKGDTIPLSALKGKMVLIDFWGTWCAPCVEEQSELARLYKKYKLASFTNGKGFEIYGVALEAKKLNWENFIAKNKITWIQVSDLKFWRSPVAKAYNIRELPFNVLIDGKGVILAKNLHGKDLEKEIGKYLRK